MSEKLDNPSRRTAILKAGRLSLASTVGVATVGSQLFAPAACAAAIQDELAEEQTEATAEKVSDVLEGTFGHNPGQRRNHTKGIGALGTFVGSPALSEYSRSLLFSGNTIEVVGRFSLAGGNPQASDSEKSARGLGLEFRLPDGSLQHITMLHTPMFFARTPQTFIDKFAALKPDPATGKPNPATFQQFLATHPDNVAQARFLNENNPPLSYAHCAFYGIHTFKLINRDNKVTNVRWRFVPHDGELALSNDQLAADEKDFLYPALVERISNGPARWDMLITIGEAGDTETDPTVLWPKDREEINAGTLTISSVSPADKAGSNRINFDPLVMSDGMAPSDDPILLFRSPSYAYSYMRRIRNV